MDRERAETIRLGGDMGNLEEFRASLAAAAPPEGLSAPLTALWWDGKSDWTRAHALVDELETKDGMAVHAYLHRKEGVEWNADYWYRLAGRGFYRPALEAEWAALVEGLLDEVSGRSGPLEPNAETVATMKAARRGELRRRAA
jgi:hypothetical protein